MAFVLKDRVKETTTTTGTGTLSLSGAVAGYQSFSAIGDGNSTYYCIEDKANFTWEIGIGTYTASGSTLSRTTVLASSNSNALVNFASGSKDVFLSAPAALLEKQKTVGTEQSASGTSFVLPGIPSWVNSFVVALNGISTNGTSVPMIQVGNSSGIVTTGYVGRGGYTFGGGNVSISTGVRVSDNFNATDSVYGQLNFVRMNSTRWSFAGNFALEGQNKLTQAAGRIELSDLDRVRITTVGGTNTFDAGTAAVIWD